MRKSLNFRMKTVSVLGLSWILSACGDSHSSSVPPGLPPPPAPKNLIEPKNAQTATAGTTAITGPAILPASLDLAALKGSSWASNCYRFSDKGDYSKKFYAFGEGTMETLLLKYKDDACTQVSLPTKAYGVWKISSIRTEAHTADWSLVKATCTSGNCSAQIDVALRIKDGQLHEGSKDSKSGEYYTADGRFVSYTKADVNLDKLAAEANGNGLAPAPTTQPVAAVSTEDATGLDLLADLAGKTYSVCIPGKPDAVTGAATSSKRSLSFAKGSDKASDTYTSTNSNYKSADCSGDGSASAPWTFTNLLVQKADIEGWILLDARACSGTGCKAQKSLLQLTTDPVGFKHAGEDNKNPGKFFTESPRIFVLAK